MVGFLIATLLLSGIVALLWARNQRYQRERFIRDYAFPTGLFDRFAKRRPQLDVKARALTGRALRQFFLAHLQSGRRWVSMPSQAADDLWHEFILYTRNYDHFCRQAFGRFMHHTPAAVLGGDRKTNEGLRRAWWYCCKEENIDPRKPNRLPLLFALDTKLGIEDGFKYSPDCAALRAKGSADVHCAGDFGSTSFDGSNDGFGDSATFGSGDGASDASGGGGSSCGGGCGGGD